MCPFIELLNGQNVENNKGAFRYHYHDYDNIDWKEKHSQAITEFANDFDIPEEKIPCLYFLNLKNVINKAIPLTQKTDVYLMLKDIISRVNKDYDSLNKVEKQLEKYINIEKYYTLFTELLSRANELDDIQNQ